MATRTFNVGILAALETQRRASMVILELTGRLLWQSADTGIAFVGAMIAMGALVAGLYRTGRCLTTRDRR